MQDLTGKVAVVTGGASGIGLGMARAFAGAGMKLVLADLDDAARDSAVLPAPAAQCVRRSGWLPGRRRRLCNVRV